MSDIPVPPEADARIEQIVGAILGIADGRFDTGLEPGPCRDEIDAIMVGINSMASELERTYRDLDERVAERTALLEQARDKMQVLAYSDPLTGLANRTALIREIEHSLDRHRRGERAPVLMLLDLDAFKSINDTHGHAIGDRVLQIVAERLRSGLRDGDVIARLGGDEFAVLLAQGTPRPLELGRRLLQLINTEVDVQSIPVSPGASMGIAEATPGHDADLLLQEADTAMYVAKQQIRDKVQEFEPFMLYERQQRAALLADLRKALGTSEIYPVYQPIVDLATGGWVGAEALVRWRHPERGVVMPLQFLELAEEAGLLPRLTDQVLNAALGDLARWRSAGVVPDSFVVHVNVTPAELHMLNFPDLIRTALRRHGLPPESLGVEITEHNMLSGDSLDRYSLLALDRMGVHTNIDDFGTGYSSISYLNKLPVDGVKLDRSIIDGIPNDTQQLDLVEAVFGLINACGLECIVEGVETAEQSEALVRMGFRHAQGYFYCRPIPAAELEAGLVERFGAGAVS
ncbi:putative bifunctional diguanylate cyclase/phosphodiesterase [Arthrobacter halodurans]|uniref:Bifunctional diguanylate cyclase/phosphodiesterase n=1 Tax=Arthrobacter halodurans TaxID=516699 RepID=A0ABV4UKT3_9MICC